MQEELPKVEKHQQLFFVTRNFKILADANFGTHKRVDVRMMEEKVRAR